MAETECPQGQPFTGQGILDNTTALISRTGLGLCVRSCHTVPLCLTNPQDISRGICRWCLQTEGTYESSRRLSKKWRGEGGGGAKVGGAEHLGGVETQQVGQIGGGWQELEGSRVTPGSTAQALMRTGGKNCCRGMVAGLKQLWENHMELTLSLCLWGLLGRTQGLAQHRGISAQQEGTE